VNGRDPVFSKDRVSFISLVKIGHFEYSGGSGSEIPHFNCLIPGGGAAAMAVAALRLVSHATSSRSV